MRLSCTLTLPQGKIGLNAAHMVMELIRDNRKIVDRISHEHINKFVDLLQREKVGTRFCVSVVWYVSVWCLYIFVCVCVLYIMCVCVHVVSMWWYVYTCVMMCVMVWFVCVCCICVCLLLISICHCVDRITILKLKSADCVHTYLCALLCVHCWHCCINHFLLNWQNYCYLELLCVCDCGSIVDMPMSIDVC